MGQLRGSATRALPPGPPTGAAANRLRSAAEPVATTPASRIQQAGERGPQAVSCGPGWARAAAPQTLSAVPPASLSRQYVSQSDLTGRQREEGEHEATQGSARQCFVLRPHWAARGVPDFSLTGELPSRQPLRASQLSQRRPRHGVRPGGSVLSCPPILMTLEQALFVEQRLGLL